MPRRSNWNRKPMAPPLSDEAVREGLKMFDTKPEDFIDVNSLPAMEDLEREGDTIGRFDDVESQVTRPLETSIPEPEPPVDPETLTIEGSRIIEVPYDVNTAFEKTGYKVKWLNNVRLTENEAICLTRLTRGLLRGGHHLASGRAVTDREGALHWLLEEIARVS